MSATEEFSRQATNEYSTFNATLARSAIMSETIVFCTLALLGGGLFALVAITNANWYYPTLFYGVVAYIAWQRYFSVSFKIEQTASAAATPTVPQATKAVSEAFQRPAEAATQAARPAADKEPPEDR